MAAKSQRKRNRKYRHVTEAVCGTPWVCLPEKLDEITDFLDIKANGGDVSAEQIRELMRLADDYGDDDDDDDDDDDRLYQTVGNLAVISFVGVMSPRINMLQAMSGGTSTMMMGQAFRAADADPNVKAIVLSLDSPGGAASYVPELASIIRATKKPTTTAATNMMASGGFWVGTASDHVYASESTLTGSVGVYTIQKERVEADEKAGIKHRVIRAGELKAAGIEYEKATAAQVASLQRRVDSIYEQFHSALAIQLNVTKAQVEDRFGKGEVFLAAEAAERGMINGVMMFEEVLDLVSRNASGAVSVFVTQEVETDMKITQRIRAALLAQNLVKSMDLDDDRVQLVIDTFFSVRGMSQPDSEDELVAALIGASAKKKKPDATLVAQAAPVSGDEVVSDRQVQLGERQRIQELQSRAELLGIDEATVAAAVDSGLSIEKALVEWTKTMTKDGGGSVVSTVKPGEAGYDNFMTAATNVLAARTGTDHDPKAVQRAGAIRNMKLIQIAQESLRLRGHRVGFDEEDDALAFLQGTNPGRMSISSTTAADHPGNHPDLMSNLANKWLDKGYATAPFTYKMWCEKMSDLANFDPRSVFETGIFGQLDALKDSESYPQRTMFSQLSAYIQAAEYGNKVGLTTHMIRANDLGGIAKQIATFPQAAQRTLHKLCVRLLSSNPTLLDGSAMFQSTGEVINKSASSGAPTAGRMALVRTALRKQPNLGDSVPIGLPINLVLLPVKWEEAAMQVFGYNDKDQKVAQTDTTINTVRGTQYVIDSYLDEYDEFAYYSFIDMMIHACIGYAHLEGVGEEGRRESWFDPDNRTRWTSYYASFGACLKSRRGVYKEDGQ